MKLWSFMRDMLVFDWLFGHRKKSVWESMKEDKERDEKLYGSLQDNPSRDHDLSSLRSYNDYIFEQDVEDDLDSFMDDF